MGAVGLYAAALGAESVMMTDGDDALLRLATRNVHLNEMFSTLCGENSDLSSPVGYTRPAPSPSLDLCHRT